MKKSLAILIAILLTLSISAEEFLNEPFDTWLPDGWTVIEGPGSSSYSHWFHRDNQFATVYVTSDNQDEWLITPDIELPSGGEIRLSADMMGSFYRMVTMDWGDFRVLLSTDNGSNWDTIWKADDQAMVEASGVQWPWAGNEWFFPSINLNTYSGQSVKIAFRYIAPDGDADWWNLDNVIVRRLNNNEVELQTFEHPEYGLINDSFSFEGSIKNLGQNDVNSFEVIYKVNEVSSSSYIVDGVSVAHNETYSFVHDIPYTYLDSEIYDLSLEIVKVNGQDDPVPANNTLERDISIATHYEDRKPMFEVFTSSTCPTCPLLNEDLDAVLANNPGEYSLVKYQVYWPGQGDPYYIVDDSIRAEYYNVGGVPNLYSNGNFDDGIGFNQSDYDAVAAEGAFSDIELNYSFNGTNVTVNVIATPTINILDASVHIAIVEKITYDNVGTNGETEFHNVLMKMLPGPYGTTITLEPGIQIELTESAALGDTFIEEFDDLEVVVWLQDNETKYVLQSESSDLMVGIDDHETKEVQCHLYPNPFTNSIMLESPFGGTYQIYDLTGRVVKNGITYTGCNSINSSDLIPGLYYFEISSERGNKEVHRLIKK